MLDLSLNEFVDCCDDVSVRLYNAIRFAASEDRLPYRSLRDYLQAGPERIDEMLRLPSLGRKSVHEFDELATRAAAECDGDTLQTNQPALSSSDPTLSIPAMFEISLPAFLAQQPAVSIRLKRAIESAVASEECPFSTVLAYLQAGGKRRIQLCKMPNLGATSAKEFEALVQAAIGNGTIAPPSQLALNEDGFPDLEGVMNALFDFLDERQTKLLLDRIESEATLEAVAQNFGVTRERIRQIERKAIEALLAKFGQTFLLASTAIETQLIQRGVREITLPAFSALARCGVMTCGLYFKFLKRLGVDEAETLALRDRVHLYRPVAFAPSETWDERIDNALINARWPLDFKEFVSDIHDVPHFYVARRLCERYHAAIAEDVFTEQPRMSTGKMCLQVLASTRMPMHLAEIRAGVFRHFGVDLTLHHVASNVGYHASVTICAPGTYVRYVDLPYSDELIKQICARMQDELESREEFLSSKWLFERLFTAELTGYPVGFNHYLLLGFAQDDGRFVVKRGNMIGLAGFDITKTFISLEDTVRNIVLEHGPIEVAEIVAHLADTRSLCNDASIKNILANSPEVIQVGRRTYDSLHRFFADREEYDALVLALRVALLAGTRSVYALAAEMATLGLHKASTEVIGSILAAADDVTQAGGLYRLSDPDARLQHYEQLARASLADGNLERLRQQAETAFGSQTAEQLIRFDRRLQTSPTQQQNKAASSELDAILADFEF